MTHRRKNYNMSRKAPHRLVGRFLYCAPGMGNNYVVKDHYALGSRKR